MISKDVLASFAGVTLSGLWLLAVEAEPLCLLLVCLSIGFRCGTAADPDHETTLL
jgi:hypothetical protein